jgi:hypothetical protein
VVGSRRDPVTKWGRFKCESRPEPSWRQSLVRKESDQRHDDLKPTNRSQRATARHNLRIYQLTSFRRSLASSRGDVGSEVSPPSSLARLLAMLSRGTSGGSPCGTDDCSGSSAYCDCGVAHACVISIGDVCV